MSPSHLSAFQIIFNIISKIIIFHSALFFQASLDTQCNINLQHRVLSKKKFIISPLGELIWKIQVQEFKKNKMLSISTKIPKKAKKPGSLQLVLPLIPEKLPSFEEDQSNFVSFELKLRVGAPNNSLKYKKAVRKFKEGTPQALIELLKVLAEEIWRQNSMQNGTDRVATIRALVWGEI